MTKKRYSTHMRDEAEKMIEAVQEALNIGKSSKIPIVISHHKCHGKKNFGKVSFLFFKIQILTENKLIFILKVNESLKIIEDSLKSQQVSLDVYPKQQNKSNNKIFIYFFDNI